MPLSYLDKIIDFIRSVGIEVSFDTINEDTFLPGILITGGRLTVDKEKLLYPGDLLHEAGHIAVMEPHDRNLLNGNVGEAKPQQESLGEEMMAIAWSYAACVKAGIPPEVVFHEAGYKGASSWYIEQYTSGSFLSMPLMKWAGFCHDEKSAEENNTAPYPVMLKWLR